MITTYNDMAAGRTIGPVDVCIIGSGAGGGTLAYYLARSGLKVVILEKGGHFPTGELGRKEVTMLTRIQSMTIFTPTSGDYTRVSLIAGECYGGGTVASESVTWDFPEVIMDDWEKLGLKSFGRSNPRLREYQEELNELLSVAPVAWDAHNPNNQLLAISAEREGVQWRSSHRPVTYCMRCGNCTQGCFFGVKQDAANTFLTWAQKHEADIYCGARAIDIKVNYPGPDDMPYREKLKQAGGAARDDILRELDRRRLNSPARFTVKASVYDRKSPAPRDKERDSKSLTVHARQVVLAAGPLGSSRLLMSSGINPNGVVGRRFTTHPTTMTLALMPNNVEIRGWDGINDSTEVDHYADTERHQPYYDPERHAILIESALSLPWGMANLLPGTGKEHLQLMKNLNHFAGVEVIEKSDAYGRITPEGVDFEMSDADNERLLFGTWLMARLLFRVGAKRVYTGLPGLILDSPSQLDEIYKYKRGRKKGFMLKQANLYSGHIFGGCIMGVDPKESFADETGECHDIKGLWAADGSAFPTNTGVNCAMSIMVVARKISDHFIEKTKKKSDSS